MHQFSQQLNYSSNTTRLDIVLPLNVFNRWKNHKILDCQSLNMIIFSNCFHASWLCYEEGSRKTFSNFGLSSVVWKIIRFYSNFQTHHINASWQNQTFSQQLNQCSTNITRADIALPLWFLAAMEFEICLLGLEDQLFFMISDSCYWIVNTTDR